ncbi:MAG: sigma 54-interacting transcriptional regulator, partial [Desulfobacula sp.]
MKDKSIILVVDDQPVNIELLEAHLVPLGYEVVKAVSGEEALKILSANQIDLVLLDVMMPVMSGFEVLEKIRADEKTRLIPVVMVTVLKETEDRVKALEAGCDDFISKPFDRHELLARVKSLLRIKSLREEVEEAREFVEGIINTVREPLIVLDRNLRVITASRFFYDFFRVKPEETLGQLVYDLGNGQWDIPQLRTLFEGILTQNSVFNDFEVEHAFESIGPKIMHLNARRIHPEKNQPQLILLAIEDVTEREYFKRNLEIIVEARTAELVLAQKEAEKGKQTAEEALIEIKILKKQLEEEKAYLKEEIKLEHNHENIIGKSDALKYVLYKVEQIAATNTTVLVLGETGTGKELVARAIHHGSPRKNRALVKINCAALPPTLIESELFGHEKGAFTGSSSKQLGRFEIADGATLFLDEIGELPMELQAKLLRVIQDGEFERLGSSHTIKVDARIIAATNRNLEEEVKKGRFREDLWYRLNVFPITMPPLRDRIDDVPLLVEYYVQKIAKRL